MKYRSRFLTLASVALFSFLTLLIANSAYCQNSAPATQELTFLNWGEYTDPQLVEKFEKTTGVKVRIIPFESDDARTRMLLSTGGKNFDLGIIDGESIEAYIRRGWLNPVDTKTIPNLQLIDPKWRKAYPNAENYAVPYSWGTTGIAYRKDIITSPITKWMQLFKPGEELRGKIFMLPQSRELIDISLKALGHSINTTDPEAYQQAKTLLKEQKPYVKKYDVPTVTGKSDLLKGSVVAVMTYSGDALTIASVDENITYVTPEEGGPLWIDYLVIFSQSKNKKYAQDFINFLNTPENAAQVAEFLYCASPNMAAEKLLPAEFLNDPIIYPPQEILDRYEIGTKIPPKIQQIRATIFAEVTSGKI